MAIPKIQTAALSHSVHRREQLPPPGRPEIAFWGRSNVGKSSLINTLLNRQRLVRTSSRPGCTQSLNFFLVNQRWYFVDLPGYGYAAVPPAVQERWLQLCAYYLRQRESLRGLVFLWDCRRQLTAEEIAILRELQARQRPVILTLTKADKISRNERPRIWREITTTLAAADLQPQAVLWVSALTQEGRQELWQQVIKLLA